MSFVLSLFVPHLSFFWCLGTAVLRDLGLFIGIFTYIFYTDLVYKLKRIVGKPAFSKQFKMIICRYEMTGYNVDVM